MPANPASGYVYKMEREALLSVKRITKEFPGVKALDEVDFDLFPGEVHILAGENGAGKSTLSKCILGLYQPESGEIFFQGRQVDFHSPKDALKAGIVSVYQELTMIPYLNAAANIYFNREPHIKGTPLINQKKMQRDCQRILKRLHCENIDTTIPVKKIGVAGQQMLEIAKALSYDPKVIIFDEPTATLTGQETDALFDCIKELKQTGTGIIYISHRISEFPLIGDRITILRDGKKVAGLDHADISEDELIHLMVGRNKRQLYERSRHSTNEEMLKVTNLSDRSGKVKGCSLILRKGEITGLAGLVGAGRTELARLIYGIDKPVEGQVLLHGKDLTGRSPGVMALAGLGFLPEDRKGSGLAIKAPINWNVLAASLGKYFPHLYLSRKKNISIAKKYTDQLNIRSNLDNITGNLSGGNQQKVVIAKWLASDSDVLIFDEPTRGIDIGARHEIYSLMDQLAAEGKAILMISSDLQEIISMSDRLYVMSEGRIISELKKEEYSMDRIGELMLKGSH